MIAKYLFLKKKTQTNTCMSKEYISVCECCKSCFVKGCLYIKSSVKMTSLYRSLVLISTYCFDSRWLCQKSHSFQRNSRSFWTVPLWCPCCSVLSGSPSILWSRIRTGTGPVRCTETLGRSLPTLMHSHNMPSLEFSFSLSLSLSSVHEFFFVSLPNYTRVTFWLKIFTRISFFFLQNTNDAHSPIIIRQLFL